MRTRHLALLLMGIFLSEEIHASPFEFVPVGDPLEAEFRILDLYSAPDRSGRIALPHLHTRPLQRVELQADGTLPRPTGARGFALARIERGLARDASGAWAAEGANRSTPRLFAQVAPNGDRVEASVALEAGAFAQRAPDRDTDGRFADRSGLHARLGVQVGNVLVFAHGFAGQFEGGRAFADPLVSDTDVIVHTEEAYVSTTSGRAWSASLGRQRFHWGPGDEGSLLLSKTSAPLTSLLARFRYAPLRIDGAAVSATLDAARGEQLAAHRLEWQPQDAVRIGLTETARYRSPNWTPLYAAGVLPYVLVQRLLVQDAPDSNDAFRNNVMIGVDASWRVADGTRVRAEWLVDDLHAKSESFPNKYGWQLGLDGAGIIEGTRLTWTLEATRLSRFTYTSFFGREHTAQGRPLGFPTGPDTRRVRASVAWDPRVEWQLAVTAAVTSAGESGLDTPFVPGSPVPEPGVFLGTVERKREWDVRLRWWPASGVDASIGGGRTRWENPGHVEGARFTGWHVNAALTLAR